MTLNYKKYMKMCLNLAKKGEGKTSPNPLVGAILIDEKGNILSKGWHKKYGYDHAEVDCIKNYERKFKNKDYSNLTLIVNLEPCNHYGKTPPCTDLIIKKKIKRVVIATADPNPAHSGGIEKLKKSGVEIVFGILENEAKSLNEVFFKNVEDKKTFVVIKTATTLDGKIATSNNSSKWITSEKSRQFVQKLRNKYDAILTSSNTVICDNPSLTARGRGYKNPIRIVLDSKLKTAPDSKVYNNDGVKVFVFYSSKNKLQNNLKDYPSNIEFVDVQLDKSNNLDLNFVIKELYKKHICSVLVEAGGNLCGAFLKENLADKIYHFVAPKILGDKNAKNFVEGFSIQDINNSKKVTFTKIKEFKPDILFEYTLKN